MKKRSSLFCLAVGLLWQLSAFSQTAGIGEVLSIESKVASYESNKSKIEQYKSELAQLEGEWQKKIQKLRDELAALYKERDDLIADMKVGARCSQCKEWKSEFEKRGVNFAQHLGEVKGYAIPATTSELEATRKSFTERIALKKVQIQNMEKGDKSLLQKQAAIDELIKANEEICKAITAHSKSYERVVFSEAKNKHEQWMNALMTYAINILIADDKITIYKARVVRYEKEYQEESLKVKERIKKEVEERQKAKTASIATNEAKIKELLAEQENALNPQEIKLGELKQQVYEVESGLRKTTTPDSLKGGLNADRKQLLERIAILEQSIKDYKEKVQSRITQLNNDSKRLKDEIFQLSVELPKLQAQEVAKLKPVYDKKKADANQAGVQATTELANARKAYSDKASYYKQENQLYIDRVIMESNRMFTAGQKISCPVWNEVRGMVMTNWNQVFPCVNSLTTMAKPYSTHVFNSYCQGKSASSYMASYKSFLSGLSEDDQQAVKGNSNSGWFELMTQ
jgi:DNA repair exonuclease SbcCD ATPase subunit